MSRQQDADWPDGPLEIGQCLFAVDCYADDSLCWNYFDYLSMFAWMLHGQSTEAKKSPPGKICISCRHYHTGEFISANVVYSVWIKPVFFAWCQKIKYIYRINVGKIAFTQIIETMFNSCLKKYKRNIQQGAETVAPWCSAWRAWCLTPHVQPPPLKSWLDFQGHFKKRAHKTSLKNISSCSTGYGVTHVIFYYKRILNY